MPSDDLPRCWRCGKAKGPLGCACRAPIGEDERKSAAALLKAWRERRLGPARRRLRDPGEEG